MNRTSVSRSVSLASEMLEGAGKSKERLYNHPAETDRDQDNRCVAAALTARGLFRWDDA